MKPIACRSQPVEIRNLKCNRNSNSRIEPSSPYFWTIPSWEGPGVGCLDIKMSTFRP